MSATSASCFLSCFPHVETPIHLPHVETPIQLPHVETPIHLPHVETPIHFPGEYQHLCGVMQLADNVNRLRSAEV